MCRGVFFIFCCKEENLGHAPGMPGRWHGPCWRSSRVCAVSAQEPREAGSLVACVTGSGEPGKEPACRARQAASPWPAGWKAGEKKHRITCFPLEGFDGIDRFQWNVLILLNQNLMMENYFAGKFLTDWQSQLHCSDVSCSIYTV